MGYFSNGSEGMSYEAKWCDRCVHQKHDDGGCVVWMLHVLHSYDDCNNPESYLHKLIPRTKDGLWNEECTMFHKVKK